MEYMVDVFNEAKSRLGTSLSLPAYITRALFIILVYGMLLSLLKPELIPALSVYEDNKFLSFITVTQRYISLFTLVISFYLFLLYGKFDGFNILFILLQVYLLILNISKGSTLAYFAYNYQAVILIIGGNVLLRQGCIPIFLEKVFKVLKFYLCTNIFLRLFFYKGLYVDPTGHWANWLFGNYMLNYYYYFMTLLIGKVLSVINSKYLKDYKITVVLVFISIFIFNSATTFYSIIFLWLYYFSIKFLSSRYRLDSYNLFLISLVLLMILRVLILKETPFLNELIVLITGKSPTYTGRTDIWQQAIKYIGLNPVMGMGYESSATTIDKVGFANMHNHLLNILYIGGWILYIFQVALTMVSLISFKQLSKNYRYYDSYTREKNLEWYISASYLSLNIYLLFETRRNFLFMYAMLFLMYYVNDIKDIKLDSGG